MGAFTISWGGGAPSVFTKVWPTHKSIMASGVLEIPLQSEKKEGKEKKTYHSL